MDLNKLKEICNRIRQTFDVKDRAREKGLPLCRGVIRNSADAIRSIHRGEFEAAQKLMEESSGYLKQVGQALKGHPDIYYVGFVYDAQKEHVEALTTYALVRGGPIPDPDQIGVEYAAYLGGLAEAIGELRRYLLDRMRRQEPGWGEEILTVMDDIYYLLVSFDYPARIVGNLKRTTDVMRSVIEKTRGDLTNAARQQHLEAAMAQLEERVEEISKRANK